MVNVLETQDVTKVFTEGKYTVPVLHGVSLVLKAGEVVTPKIVEMTAGGAA